MILQCSGHIDKFDNGYIEGWFYSPNSSDLMLITINGHPVNSEIEWIYREDVCEHLEISGAFGFRLKVLICIFGNVDVKLFSVSHERSMHIHERSLLIQNNNPSTISQLDRVVAISKQPDSVAVVVWEGKHNPIGRAKVLYDIVSTNRSACIIAFDFNFSENPIWSPIQSLDIPIFMFRWEDRFMVHQFTQKHQVKFSTVWACKPRLPTFELSNIFGNDLTRYILDIDDNEEHLSQSDASRTKPFGRLAFSRAMHLMKNMPVRSVASVSLQDKFGGTLIRHARHPFDSSQINGSLKESLQNKKNIIKIIFIGTVRPHKGIQNAIKYINEYNKTACINVELYVGGNFIPASLKNEMADSGIFILGEIANDALFSNLSKYDVVITGFPAKSDDIDLITYYQISSKIGDALACGKPVLTPDGASVSDLNYPGVFRFNRENFSEMLHKAISFNEKVNLPEEFDVSFAYKSFALLEKAAEDLKKSSKIAIRKNFNSFFKSFSQSTSIEYKTYKNIILVWKQNDAGVYGRRVDIVARTLKLKIADVNVRVLEFSNPDILKHHKRAAYDPASDSSIILDRIEKKELTYENSNVLYDNIHCVSLKESDNNVKDYLLRHELLPSNTTFILFPLVPGFRSLINVLHGYKIISDVVDNQMSWLDTEQKMQAAVYEYKALSLFSDAVIFNSLNNLENFNRAIIQTPDVTSKTHHIPNWYLLPDEVSKNDRNIPNNKKLVLIYSGNMNDRIDWKLFNLIASEFIESVEIVIIGNAARARTNLEKLTQNKNVSYLGPLDEHDCLKELMIADLAIMPHITDDTSTYMNPLKIKMYEVIGLTCISTSVPGLDQESNLKIATTSEEFVNMIRTEINSKRFFNESILLSNENVECAYSLKYVELVESVMLK